MSKTLELTEAEASWVYEGKTTLLLRPIRELSNPKVSVTAITGGRASSGDVVRAVGFRPDGDGIVECDFEINVPFRSGVLIPIGEAYWRDGTGISYREEVSRLTSKGFALRCPARWHSAMRLPAGDARADIVLDSLGFGALSDLAGRPELGMVDPHGGSLFRSAYERSYGRLRGCAWSDNPYMWALWIREVVRRQPGPTRSTEVYPVGVWS